MSIKRWTAAGAAAVLLAAGPAWAVGQKPPGGTAEAPAAAQPNAGGEPQEGDPAPGANGMLMHVDIAPSVEALNRVIRGTEGRCQTGNQGECGALPDLRTYEARMRTDHDACHRDDTEACRRYIAVSRIVLNAAENETGGAESTVQAPAAEATAGK